MRIYFPAQYVFIDFVELRVNFYNDPLKITSFSFRSNFITGAGREFQCLSQGLSDLHSYQSKNVRSIKAGKNDFSAFAISTLQSEITVAG